MKDSTKGREEILDQIRKYYKRRIDEHRFVGIGTVARESRLNCYAEAFAQIGVLPLDGRRLLDVGCGATGSWVLPACERWGAKLENCWGVELIPDYVERGRKKHPGIQLIMASADKMPFSDEYFDIVHHSMMFSSVPDEGLRKAMGREMWRVLKPGGYIMWYDFIWNPLNPNVKGMRKKDIREIFPDAEWVYCRRIGLAPPIIRLINHVSERLVIVFERLVIFNAFYLCMLRKTK
jgi:SAM-dependent methyltransferase